MKTFSHLSACLVASALLVACGGGSGSPTAVTPPVTAPVVVSNAVPNANAGLDQTLPTGSLATLDAGASTDANGDILTYAWRLSGQPAGSKATLAAPSSVRPQILLDVDGVYTATLTVNDGKSDSAIDAVSIIATRPVPAVKAPLAHAGTNQSVLIGANVTLDGTASSTQQGALAYRWMFLSNPSATATLKNASTARPTFTADIGGTYTIGLVVNNGVADSAIATVLVIAAAPPTNANSAPLANAGSDQSVQTGALVLLDGALSKDANGDRLTYAWTLTTKPFASTAVLATPTASTSSFRADLSGIYELRLSVNDGKVDSLTSDLITVVAAPATAASVADTGTYRCATLSHDQALSLYAAGHGYLDRDHDGKPCEANDLVNEQLAPYVAPAPAPATSGRCWVNGYTRKNGTHVNGYYRSC